MMPKIRLPFVLLLLYTLVFLYTGWVTYDWRVWLGESVVTIGCIVFAYFMYRKNVFSDTSYRLIFVFLVLAKIGVAYGFENVPIDAYTSRLFNFRMSEVFGFERNHYDRFVHFTGGLLIYRPAFEVAAHAGIKNIAWRHFFSFMFINGCSGVYEIIELAGSYMIEEGLYLTYLSHQGDVLDAPKDMAMAMAGALLAMAVMLLTRRDKNHN